MGIKVNDNSKTVLTADKEYECERVIIATGAANRNLGVDGEGGFSWSRRVLLRNL